ncbi:hypothetical protein [Streptomyces mordarskii]|uniref:hypothetical protein n=1 Tax=Streptomyces mordarskii TaxID=1226758 RepID=UPI0031F9C211
MSNIKVTINGASVDPTDGEALAEAGVSFGGSIVAGTSHRVTGGTVHGNVYGGQAKDDQEPTR